MFCRGLMFLVCVSLAVVAPPGRLELGAQTGASRFALAQVTDSRGRPLVDIDLDDFLVEEAGTARDVLDLRVADYPLVLVVDNGAGAADDFTALRAAVARFLARLGPRPVALVSAAGPPMVVAGFEDERAAVTAKLDEMEVARGAASQPLQAAALGGKTIQTTGTLFSTVVVATASPDDVAESGAAETLAPVIDSRAVVHVVANTARIGANDRLLRSLAEQTHGEYLSIYSPASYQPALDRLAQRLTTELLIEYLVPVGSKPADVKLGVRLAGARVRGLGVAPK
jgi:hypothetical protein